ncbi:MAG: DNA-3-methyladenine glycosylase 2 family protein [Planctomycetes bacterium]|nr:DNA-3-methyladenine glycosylase 2 family protein [Planctomycetota bacterium]
MPRPLSAPDVKVAAAHLCRVDGALAPWVRRLGPAPLRRQGPAFPSLCKSIIAQQLSAKAAGTIIARFFALFGNPPGARRPVATPQQVRAASPRRLRAAGVSRQKADYLRSLATAFDSGRVNPRRFARMNDEAVIAELTSVRGVGVWTAEMFLIFVLGRPDVFSCGDLALRAGIARIDGVAPATPAAAAARAEPWAPWRSVASLYLWQIAHAPFPVREASRPV